MLTVESFNDKDRVTNEAEIAGENKRIYTKDKRLDTENTHTIKNMK